MVQTVVVQPTSPNLSDIVLTNQRSEGILTSSPGPSDSDDHNAGYNEHEVLVSSKGPTDSDYHNAGYNEHEVLVSSKGPADSEQHHSNVVHEGNLPSFTGSSEPEAEQQHYRIVSHEDNDTVSSNIVPADSMQHFRAIIHEDDYLASPTRTNSKQHYRTGIHEGDESAASSSKPDSKQQHYGTVSDINTDDNFSSSTGPVFSQQHYGTADIHTDDDLPSSTGPADSRQQHYNHLMPDDWVEPADDSYSMSEVLLGHFTHYTSFPMTLLNLTRVRACETLEENVGVITLENYQDLFPKWLVNATLVGECPWELVQSELAPGTVPPSIIEVKCLCDGHRCSGHGVLRCISVTRDVKTWIINPFDYDQFIPRTARVTVACVCAQRYSPLGGYIEPGVHN
ncbi:hypothetical protein Pmani_016417 [Petrolisthes manimaculis]|uniref:Uncharacterized protein n=1 Tax=Petrolisthes manimaculis TaxID=1843537 RepID=A0AAE1UB13_9EUCA|nr:hypothetical protein Pmani_016417 [Petrolisthes manimaculis]